MPIRLSSAQRQAQLRHRKYMAALVRYFHTGVWLIPSSPVLCSARLAWQSTAKPGTLLAKSR